MIQQHTASAVHTCYHIEYMLRNVVAKVTSDEGIVSDWIEAVSVDMGRWTEQVVGEQLGNKLAVGFTVAGDRVGMTAVSIILSYCSDVLIFNVPPTREIPNDLTEFMCNPRVQFVGFNTDLYSTLLTNTDIAMTSPVVDLRPRLPDGQQNLSLQDIIHMQVDLLIQSLPNEMFTFEGENGLTFTEDQIEMVSLFSVALEDLYVKLISGLVKLVSVSAYKTHATHASCFVKAPDTGRLSVVVTSNFDHVQDWLRDEIIDSAGQRIDLGFYVAKTAVINDKGCLLCLSIKSKVLIYRLHTLGDGIPPESLMAILISPRYNLVGMSTELHKVALLNAVGLHDVLCRLTNPRTDLPIDEKELPASEIFDQRLKIYYPFVDDCHFSWGNDLLENEHLITCALQAFCSVKLHHQQLRPIRMPIFQRANKRPIATPIFPPDNIER